ncbi:hypothetical protein [Solirubrobacter soli]|uniref:hypothetical protein n=1 Tax=Solirubrobacter soli TaxID=363832 RepID=UPI0003F6F0BF|nr:hypothetical protein [Solirubrobacter soli]
MLRTLLVSAGLLACVPAAASASPFGELPFQPVSGTATCLRATGTPGELIRQSEENIEALDASATGLTPAATLAAGGISGCADAASWAGGGSVVAFAVGTELQDETWARAYVREPGQAWGQSVDVVEPEEGALSTGIATAASPRGDALVAFAGVTSKQRATLRVARRLPGGAFTPAETLQSRRTGDPVAPVVHAGFAASGEAIVLWTYMPDKEGAERELWAATAPPGAPFGAPQKIDPIASGLPYDLAVAPDGRVLVTFVSGDQLVAAERPPGGRFGYPFLIADTIDEFGVVPTVALRPDGGAIVGWAGLSDATMTIRTRQAPGVFGPAIAIGRAHRLESPPLMTLVRLLETALTGLQGEFGIGGAPPDTRGGNPRALLGADGRVLLTWAQIQRSDGVWRMLPRAALVNFEGGEREPIAVGGTLRNVDSLVPVGLPDGSRGVAWTDNSGRLGRVHVAREGSPQPADPPAPAVRLQVAGSHTLAGQAPLRLRATCDAACDVYAQLVGNDQVGADLSLPGAGSGRLELTRLLRPVAPRGGGPVHVLLRASAPGARTATTRTLTFRLRRAPAKLPPVPLGLTAVRDGDVVVVRWHTAKPASPRDYFVLGYAGGEEPVTGGDVAGRAKRTSFVTRLRDVRRRVTRVTVVRADPDTLETGRTSVRVQE